MKRGGKRNGAGRPPGSKTEKRYHIAARAATEGVSPMEVMLYVMRELFEKKQYREAAEVAKDAAPYCHPRLSNIDAKVNGNLTIVVKKP